MTRHFATLDDIRAALANLPGPDRAARDAAGARNAVLTKPPGALGRLRIWRSGMPAGAARRGLT